MGLLFHAPEEVTVLWCDNTNPYVPSLFLYSALPRHLHHALWRAVSAWDCKCGITSMACIKQRRCTYLVGCWQSVYSHGVPAGCGIRRDMMHTPRMDGMSMLVVKPASTQSWQALAASNVCPPRSTSLKRSCSFSVMAASSWRGTYFPCLISTSGSLERRGGVLMLATSCMCTWQAMKLLGGC